MSEPFQPPDGMPRLSRGTHSGPQAGACFMEYVSLLAGEPWSDQPRCTHPLLAEVARAVNDSVTQAGRDRLLSLLPTVIGRVSDDPRTGALLVDRLVTSAAALGVTPGPVLRAHQRRARRRLRRLDAAAQRRTWTVSTLTGPVRALGAVAYQEGPGVRAVDAVCRAVARLPAARRDEAFRSLLISAIDTIPQAADDTGGEAGQVPRALRAMGATGATGPVVGR